MWRFRGKHRPRFADEPGPNQESVWDYPRPPALEPSSRLVEVHALQPEKDAGEPLARSRGAIRVLETASPPTWYLPPGDIRMERLQPLTGSSFCEWKGRASYWTLAGDPAQCALAWSYADPTPAFRAIAGWLCFYPDRAHCTVDGERVRPQEGGFYGGWVTDDIVGPWKGQPGTGGW
jgi:uncharacterized protein (DUF427 family)